VTLLLSQFLSLSQRCRRPGPEIADSPDNCDSTEFFILEEDEGLREDTEGY
jgi:hypothetical protein